MNLRIASNVEDVERFRTPGERHKQILLPSVFSGCCEDKVD